MILGFVKQLSSMGRVRKRSILIGYDLVAMAVALWAAFSARLGEIYFPDSLGTLAAAATSFVIGIAALYRLQVYHLVLRYFHMRAVSRILAASAVAAMAWVITV